MARLQNDFSKEVFEAVGVAVGHLGRCGSGNPIAGITLEGFSVRSPRVPGEEYLLVLKGLDSEEEPLVAFHSAFTLEDTFRGAVNRLLNGSLKWRPDDFRK